MRAWLRMLTPIAVCAVVAVPAAAQAGRICEWSDVVMKSGAKVD